MGVLKSLKEVKSFCDNFNFNIFSFDTETTGLIYTVLEIEGISICDGNTSCYIDLINNRETWKILSYLKSKFENADILVAHNVVFDLKVLYKYGIKPNCNLYDTMIADHLIDENRRHGLKVLAKEFLKVDTIKYEEAEKAGHQSKLFYEYAENDAVWTWELMKLQMPVLKKNNLLKLFTEIEMPYQYCLLEMVITGILIDIERVKKTTMELKIAHETITKELYDELKEPYEYQKDLLGNLVLKGRINFSSPMQLSEILFKRLKLDIVEKTPTGNPSVGKLTIAKYKKSNKFVKILNKYKIISKLLSGFFEPMPKFIELDNRIRPSFIDIGTTTGRLSCRSPNLQQLPKANKEFPVETRACFIVPEGYTMVTCDYSGQELRVLAQITQAKNMIKAFHSGKDFHQETADAFKVDRTKAKAINFGIAYGKTAHGFALDWNCSEKEAQEYLDKYFINFPEVKKAMEDNFKFIQRKGYNVTLTGRRRHYKKIKKKNWEGYPKKVFRQGFNFLIQGYSADMIRMASIATYNTSKLFPEWGLTQVASVHDENIYQIKTQYLQEACDRIQQDFENVVELCVLLKSDIGIGANYAEAK